MKKDDSFGTLEKLHQRRWSVDGRFGIEPPLQGRAGDPDSLCEAPLADAQLFHCVLEGDDLRDNLISGTARLKGGVFAENSANFFHLLFLGRCSCRQANLSSRGLFLSHLRSQTVSYGWLHLAGWLTKARVMYWNHRDKIEKTEDYKLIWNKALKRSVFFLGTIIVLNWILLVFHVLGVGHDPTELLDQASVFSIVDIVIIAAITLDLFNEIRARRAVAIVGDLQPMEIHHDVGDALEAVRRFHFKGKTVSKPRDYRHVDYEVTLDAPAVIQGIHFRSLFYMFAPHVPMVVLALPSDRDERGVDDSPSTSSNEESCVPQNESDDSMSSSRI